MEFEVGDRVVHPVYGVGTVKTVSAQRFGEGEMRQYYEVATGDATVWVPIDAQGVTVLRGITSKQSLDGCRQLLSGDPIPFDKSPKLRQVEIAARLKGGLLSARCEMVRDLRARSAHAPLPESEDRLLARVFKVLCDEWAASAGISAQAAVQEIEDLLHESRESQSPEERNHRKYLYL